VGITSPSTPVSVFGRYAVFSEVAAGGMATIHLGRLLGPVGFFRTVAIKRLHPQFANDPDFVTMFIDEARLAARIRHPNVVAPLDVVATQGELLLVMDYVQGESLAHLWRTATALGTLIPAPVSCAIVSDLLRGLHAAHEATNELGEPLGIVHRDVSPQNVLVGIDGIARVLDFGIAHAAGRSSATRDGQLQGKIAYMAPECFHDIEVTRQVDVYAAGIVLWEMLTGKRLFKGEDEATTLSRVLTAEVAPPSTIADGISPELDAVVVCALRRDPAERFATAQEMNLALEACADLATATQVGPWVQATASKLLARRAEQLAEVEQASDCLLQANSATWPQARPTVPLSISDEPSVGASTATVTDVGTLPGEHLVRAGRTNGKGRRRR
jgi:serine/threonine-protein kinase